MNEVFKKEWKTLRFPTALDANLGVVTNDIKPILICEMTEIRGDSYEDNASVVKEVAKAISALPELIDFANDYIKYFETCCMTTDKRIVDSVSQKRRDLYDKSKKAIEKAFP